MKEESLSVNDTIERNLKQKIEKIFEEEGFETVSVEFDHIFSVHGSKTRSVEVNVAGKTESKKPW